MYLTEAEATPELKDCVLAANLEEIDYSQVVTGYIPTTLSHYLSFIKKLVSFLI